MRTALKEVARDQAVTRTLDLAAIKITDAGMKRNLRIAMICGTLSLSETAITDIGVKDLSRIGSLTELTLYDTRITDAAMKNLGEMKQSAIAPPSQDQDHRRGAEGSRLAQEP